MVYTVNHSGNECTWQAVSGDHYFIGTVSGFVQRGRRDNTVLHS